MDIDSNVVERAAEAACQAWMKTDLGATWPDRSPADMPLDSQEWSDFWQGLGIERRKVFRAQAEAVLSSAAEPVADPGAVERVRLLVAEFEARGARYMNPGSPGDELAVADLRAVLLELRRARALAIDPANTCLVTVKLPKDPDHNPRAKRVGPCPFSNECSDVTGEHHSFLTTTEGLEALREGGTHITRTERVQRSPEFLREGSRWA